MKCPLFWFVPVSQFPVGHVSVFKDKWFCFVVWCACALVCVRAVWSILLLLSVVVHFEANEVFFVADLYVST
jgi:hypothetical protein